MRYSVQLIDSIEKDRLYQLYESRLLYTAKAGIYGCCIKLLTEVEYVKDRWEDNFYTMSEDVRSHGRLLVLEEPGQQMTVKYDPYTKTAFLINVDYYGWIKSIALAVAGDILEDEHRIYSVHGAAIDIGGHGVSLIAPSGTGKTTHSWGLLRLKNARLVSDDWYFVRLSSREPLAFVVPFFFANVGINFDFNSLSMNTVLLIGTVAIAFLGKIFGTLIVKPASNLSLKQLYYVGWAMNSRGAAELVIALVAFRFGLIPIEIFSVLVAMAMITTLTFPFVLSRGIKKNPGIMDEKTPIT